MIDYATYRRIHHLNEAETLNVAQIAERLALDPRTVRYWLDEPTFRPRQTAPRPSKLDPYKPLIRQWLEHYPYSGTQIFQRLGDAGYTGGISIVHPEFTNGLDNLRYINDLRCRKPAYGTTNAVKPDFSSLRRSSYASRQPTTRCRGRSGSPAAWAPPASPCARAKCARRHA